MSKIVLLSIGFGLGAFIIGTGLTMRVRQCVEEYAQPCVIEQTLTGTTVLPVSAPPSIIMEEKRTGE